MRNERSMDRNLKNKKSTRKNIEFNGVKSRKKQDGRKKVSGQFNAHVRDFGASQGRFEHRHRVPRETEHAKEMLWTVEGSEQTSQDGLIYGRNAVLELLKSDQSIDKIWILKQEEQDRDHRLRDLFARAKEAGILIVELDRKGLDRMCGHDKHQGIVAQVPQTEYVSLQELVEQHPERKFLILLERVQDPHNVGAVLRVADTVGAQGVIIGKHYAPGLNATVAKAAAGALQHVPVARVHNLAQALDWLKEAGYWILAADMSGEDMFQAQTLDRLIDAPLCLVIGSEGDGVSQKILERADLVLRIPMQGAINSLNASVSSAVLSYEILRRRLQRA